jgi:hypothetical protein
MAPKDTTGIGWVCIEPAAALPSGVLGRHDPAHRRGCSAEQVTADMYDALVRWGSLHVDGDGAGLCSSSFRWIVHFTLPVRIFVASAESIDGSGISH